MATSVEKMYIDVIWQDLWYYEGFSKVAQNFDVFIKTTVVWWWMEYALVLIVQFNRNKDFQGLFHHKHSSML